VVFTASDGTTKLDHEVEQYTSGTGTLVAWVRIPSLSSTVDTQIYMYYGNPSVGSQANPTGVWDTGYGGVYHLSGDPTPTGSPNVADSTSNARNGTSSGAMTSANQISGEVAGSLDFDGVNDRVDTTNYGGGATQLTLETWVYKRDTGNDRLIAKADTTTTSSSGHVFSMGVNNQMLWGFVATGGGGATQLNGSVSIPFNTWTHVALTYDGSNMRLYVNGVNTDTAAKTGTINTGSQVVVLANNDNIPNDRYLYGGMDEARVSTTGRSTAWLATEYANMNSPAGFSTSGAEVASGWTAATDQKRTGSYALKANGISNTSKWITANAVTGQADVVLDAYWRVSVASGMNVSQAVRTANGASINEYETTLSPSGGSDVWTLGKGITGTFTTLNTPSPATASAANTWTRVTTIVSGTQMQAYKDDVQMAPNNGWTAIGSELANGGIGFRAYNTPSASWWVDDVVVRRYASPEPTTSTGITQTA
jgi:hypothetical protein